MKGSIFLDSVSPYTYPTGARGWLVVCGECAGRAKMFDNGNYGWADFCRPWIVDTTQADAEATLARHNRLHNGQEAN
jgi:hypothetical protein